VKLPLLSVRTGRALMVDPSHVVLSVGRFAVVPPGSAHSRIWRPDGSAVRVGKPVPEMLIVWPSVYGPAGMLRAGPAA
jgi:hypothetical protein